MSINSKLTQLTYILTELFVVKGKTMAKPTFTEKVAIKVSEFPSTRN